MKRKWWEYFAAMNFWRLVNRSWEFVEEWEEQYGPTRLWKQQPGEGKRIPAKYSRREKEK